MTGAPNPAPADALLQKLGGKWVVQALATAAELRLADVLTEPEPLSTLARKLACHPPALERLLRVLVGEGVLVEHPDGRFELTPMGVLLRRDAFGPLAEFVGSAPQWNPWTELTYAVRTGRSAFEKVHGRSLYDFLAHEPEHAALYDHAVDAFTTAQARALAHDPALAHATSLVDVGGGRGTLLLELLRARPQLRGVLFDRPHVVEHARPRFERAGLSERCACVAGDFFQTLPEGHDTYVLKHVLHNWDDDRAIDLLRRCTAAIPRDGRVLVVDALLLPIAASDPGRLMDLEMLVLTGGGRERSKPQMRQLLRRAGLRLAATRMLAPGAWLMVGEPV